VLYSGAGAVSQYSYDNLGRRTLVQRPNGVNSSYSYDDVSRLTGLSIEHPTSTYDVTWTYGYNPAGQVVSQSQSNSLYSFTGRVAGTTSYTNNALNQATAAGRATLTYNAEGDLTSDGAGGYSYAYDRYSRPVTLSGIQTIAWDALGRLKTMTGTLGADYLYDADGQLAGTTVNGATIANRLVPGPWPDEIALAWQGSDLSLPYWSAQDRMGSVVSITDGSGGMVALNTYDEYGRPGNSNGGRLMYTGQMWLPDWGMYHYKTRQYRPDLGRFLQVDTIGYLGGANLYIYINADPVNWTDTNGTCPQCLGVVIGGLFGGGLEAYAQYREYGQITDLGRIGVQASIGAVAGGTGVGVAAWAARALAPVAAGALGGFVGGAFGGGASNGVSAYLDGASAGNVLTATASGGLEGGFWGAISGGTATGITARYGPRFARIEPGFRPLVSWVRPRDPFADEIGGLGGAIVGEFGQNIFGSTGQLYGLWGTRSCDFSAFTAIQGRIFSYCVTVSDVTPDED